MKINNLIEELNDYNLNADITLTSSEDIAISYICKDLNGNDLTKKTTMQVFIKGVDKYRECSSEYINEETDELWCNYYDKPCKDKETCEQFEEFYE